MFATNHIGSIDDLIKLVPCGPRRQVHKNTLTRQHSPGLRAQLPGADQEPFLKSGLCRERAGLEKPRPSDLTNPFPDGEGTHASWAVAPGLKPRAVETQHLTVSVAWEPQASNQATCTGHKAGSVFKLSVERGKPAGERRGGVSSSRGPGPCSHPGSLSGFRPFYPQTFLPSPLHLCHPSLVLLQQLPPSVLASCLLPTAAWLSFIECESALQWLPVACRMKFKLHDPEELFLAPTLPPASSASYLCL